LAYKLTKMKKILILTFFVFISCNFSKSFEEIKHIQDDLSAKFGHDKLSVVLHWGTENDDNYSIITFYQYPINGISYDELELKAHKVANHIKTNFPKFKKLDYIEVRYSKYEESDNNDSFITFKVKPK